MANEPRALLVDVTRCIGCRACVGACQESHGFPRDEAVTSLGVRSYTALVDLPGDRYVRRLCMHCVSPSCASVCPVGALRKSPAGPVTYDARICLGCRYCMVACPFDVPRYEYRASVPSVRKCDFCVDRLARGQVPACVEACPVEATVTGTRADLLAEAKKRIAENPGAYFDRVYGEQEAGGTSVLFLSPVPFEQMGFKAGLPSGALPDITWGVLEKIPGVASIGGAALFAVWWITHRRQEVAAAEEASHAH